jgi:hypothetical protein
MRFHSRVSYYWICGEYDKHEQTMSHFSFMARFLLPRTSFYSVPVPSIFENSKSSFSSISFKTHSQNDNFSDTKQQITTLCSKGHIKKAFESFLYDIWTEPRLFSILSHTIMYSHKLCFFRKTTSFFDFHFWVFLR